MKNEDDIDTKRVERLQESMRESPMLTVEKLSYWIILFCILGILAAFILWGVLGKIPTEITGRSVAISSNGVYLISSPSEGTLSKLYVTQGDKIREGEELALFNAPKLRSILSSMESTKYKIEQLNQQSLLLQKALSINISLYKKGLIAKMVIDQSRSNVMDKGIEIEGAKSELSNSFSSLEENAFVDQKKFAFFKTLLAAPIEVIDFPQILEDLSTFLSPSDGQILEILAAPGDVLKENTPLFWVERPSEKGHPLVFYGTVDSAISRRLREGMKVIIGPANVNPDVHGAIIGKIEDISLYPVSAEELKDTIGNEQIVSYLLESRKAMIQISVLPELDPETVSGFKWTSKEGPPYQIPTGTMANFRIIVDEQSPISYLIHLFRVED